MSWASNGSAALLLLLQTMSRLTGEFHLLPTFSSHALKYRSEFGSALIPSASRYHRSFPSYCDAGALQISAASAAPFPRMAIATSLLTCGDGSFFKRDAAFKTS